MVGDGQTDKLADENAQMYPRTHVIVPIAIQRIIIYYFDPDHIVKLAQINVIPGIIIGVAGPP